MSGCSNGGTTTAPSRSAHAAQADALSSKPPGVSTTSAPYARVASTLGSGAPSGMNTVARTPARRADSATPCAWLPAEAHATPRARSSSVRREMR